MKITTFNAYLVSSLTVTIAFLLLGHRDSILIEGLLSSLPFLTAFAAIAAAAAIPLFIMKAALLKYIMPPGLSADTIAWFYAVGVIDMCAVYWDGHNSATYFAPHHLVDYTIYGVIGGVTFWGMSTIQKIRQNVKHT
ncbi:MAG: hypothetical protein ABJN42_13790 [Roseibium sp.]|uniref:hypothetical protein n=1 Tax=Roseibium sp. TaxID=1936156 RepID=UPI003297848C